MSKRQQSSDEAKRQRSKKEEYLPLMKEYRADIEGLREAGVSQEERSGVAKDYDETFTQIRDSLGVDDSDERSDEGEGTATRWKE